MGGPPPASAQDQRPLGCVRLGLSIDRDHFKPARAGRYPSQGTLLSASEKIGDNLRLSTMASPARTCIQFTARRSKPLKQASVVPLNLSGDLFGAELGRVVSY